MKNKGAVLVVIGAVLVIIALSLTIFNIITQKQADIASGNIMQKITQIIKEQDSEGQPLYKINPNIDMPEIEIDGNYYIATIALPALGLELPVNTLWNYKNLKTSPCRYSGSAYLGDLIICAHNYPSHFGNIGRLSPGDSIYLMDMDGNSFEYEVMYVEVLDSYSYEELTSGEWDLTLFTCTIGGTSRVTIRCKLV